MCVAVKLTIQIGACTSEAILMSAHKAKSPSQKPNTPASVIQFTDNDSAFIYCKPISGDR